MRWIFGLLASLIATGAVAQIHCGQIRLVVPYPPGGATDVAARLVAERLEPALKKTVVIENRAGATGNIGHHRRRHLASGRVHAAGQRGGDRDVPRKLQPSPL
jgi:tripartite-type tricarboxylate transporter receptor subunit TctC